MNLQSWGDLIQALLSQYDQNSKIDDRVIFALTDTCRGTVLADIYRKTKQWPTGDYIRTFKVDLIPFEDTLVTFKLPITISNAVGNMGIRSISNTKFPYQNWNFIDVGRTAQFKEADYGGKPFYWLEGQDIISGNVLGDKAKLKIIPSLADPAMDTDWEIFGNSEIEGRVRDMVLSKLMPKKETPKISANNGRT